MRLDHLLSKEYRLLLTEAIALESRPNGWQERGTPSWCTGYSDLDCRVRLVDLGLVEFDARARRSLFRFEGVPARAPRGTGQHRSAVALTGLRRAPGQGLSVDSRAVLARSETLRPLRIA